MEEYKCAFSSTLVTNRFACDKGEQVTRRSGPDVACTSDAAHQRCEQLYDQMKFAALPAFGVQDDLLTMPHSVMLKIQHGGLLGLQRLLEPGAAGSGEVKNIHGLVAQAVEKYGSVEAIPCPALVADMSGYKLRRRG
ncbi:MAG: hypothetical protein OEY27_02365 [Gammaproteobacteria bacterium]|nr:hypothetical protein [Gammaproteobacteria bacterium]